MKRLIILSVISLATLSPMVVNAQKQTSKKSSASLPLKLVSAEDSLSYALGVSLYQGLPQYLVQSGVIVDTLSMGDHYRDRLATAQSKEQKERLTKEWMFKRDSVYTANKKNINQFLEGLTQGMTESGKNPSFNVGIGVANQLVTVKDKFATDFWNDKSKFNLNAFMAAFKGSLKNEDPLIPNAQNMIQEASMKMQEAKDAKDAEALKGQYQDKIAEGDRFMDENKKKEGVVVVPSGLQYKIIKKGTGEKPKMSDRVKVDYTGKLIDGQIFDSSVQRGEPAVFGVGQVIKGWTEALQLMPVGSKWEICIPYNLAYGSKDQGVIKPFSNLIFEVELLGIEK